MSVMAKKHTSHVLVSSSTGGAAADAVVPDPRELIRIKGPHYSFFLVVVVYLGYWSVWPASVADLWVQGVYLCLCR